MPRPNDKISSNNFSFQVLMKPDEKLIRVNVEKLVDIFSLPICLCCVEDLRKPAWQAVKGERMGAIIHKRGGREKGFFSSSALANFPLPSL